MADFQKSIENKTLYSNARDLRDQFIWFSKYWLKQIIHWNIVHLALSSRIVFCNSFFFWQKLTHLMIRTSIRYVYLFSDKELCRVYHLNMLCSTSCSSLMPFVSPFGQSQHMVLQRIFFLRQRYHYMQWSHFNMYYKYM